MAIGETSARGSDKPTGLRPTHTPGKFAELVAKANPRLKFDAWSHHPYPFNPNSPPSQRREVAERLARVAPSVRREPEDVVQAQVGPDLDHRVRAPDPPGGLARRAVRDAGGLYPAVHLDGCAPPVREHVHLVRLPGRPGPAVGVRDLYARRVAKGHRRRRGSPRARGRSIRETAFVLLKRGTLTPLVNVYTRRYCATNPTGSARRHDVACLPRRSLDQGRPADRAAAERTARSQRESRSPEA